jgi:hypothetical protein
MSPRALRAIGGHVAVLPAPRPQRSPVLLLLIVIGALILLLLASAPRVQTPTATAQPVATSPVKSP